MVTQLKEYGKTFQLKLISSLLTDNHFLLRIYDILEPTNFESESLQWITEKIKDHYREYKTSPSLEVFAVKVKSISDDLLRLTVTEDLKQSLKYAESDDLPYIKEESLTFFKNQRYKKAVMMAVDFLKRGDYDGIRKEFRDADQAGNEQNVGHDYVNEVDARYSVTARNVKETPWSALNDITEGGFGKGELILVAAPPGIGKSWWLVNIAAHLIQRGNNVVYFSLELNESYVGLRHDAVITGYPLQDLKYHIDDIKSTMSSISGKLFVQYYPTRSATINTLRGYLERQKLIGNRIDAVIVDYADLLRGDSKKARHEELEEIVIDLRGLAGEYEVPLFSASQINREGSSEEVITGDKIAGSFSKLMTADFVISLSRKLEDKMTGTGRFYLIKNRFGADGITFPSKMNLSTGRMEIFPPTSVEGKSAKRQSESGTEAVRTLIGQKYKEMNGDF